MAFLCHKQSEELPFSIFSVRRTCPAFPFVGLAGPKKGMGETCVSQSGDALWAQVGWLFLQLDDSYLWNFMTQTLAPLLVIWSSIIRFRGFIFPNVTFYDLKYFATDFINNQGDGFVIQPNQTKTKQTLRSLPNLNWAQTTENQQQILENNKQPQDFTSLGIGGKHTKEYPIPGSKPHYLQIEGHFSKSKHMLEPPPQSY